MRRLSKWTAVALVAAMPMSMVACGGDEDDDTPGTGGSGGKGGSSGSTGKGGSSGSTGKGGSSGSTGKGGSGGGDAGTGNEGGTGNEAGSGTGNEGGTGNEAGTGAVGGEAGSDVVAGAGGGGGDGECDLSGDGKERVTLDADIDANMTLDANNVYYIDGRVHILDGATLTIPPCTRIEGSPAPDAGILIATRGGRIEAVGTADEPILFTSAQPPGSRQPGQWGGIVLLGRAPITANGGATEAIYEGLTEEIYTYGGTAEDDDSGHLSYVRIEFGGYVIEANKEVNGLSMAGVGSGTTIDHIMVSNTLDDCFEWWGGSVSGSHLVCNNPGDDYFDGDSGWMGGADHIFGRRAQFAISSDDPNGFELDSADDGTEPFTAFTIEDATLCGTGEASGRPNPSFGMMVREFVTGTFDNTALVGFEYGIDTEDAFAVANVPISNSFAWELVSGLGSPDATDDDGGFDDASLFNDGTDNTLDPDPAPFSLDECNDIAGPAAAVLESDIGAFTGGAGWLDGAWIDWAED